MPRARQGPEKEAWPERTEPAAGQPLLGRLRPAVVSLRRADVRMPGPLLDERHFDTRVEQVRDERPS